MVVRFLLLLTSLIGLLGLLPAVGGHLAGRLMMPSAPPAPTLVLIPFGAASEDRLDAMSSLIRSGSVSHIVILQASPSFTEQLGAQPIAALLARDQLIERGVSADQIEVLMTQAVEDRQALRALENWLRRNPDQTVSLVGRNFQAAYLQAVVAADMTQEVRDQVRIWNTVTGPVTPGNWWRSGTGIKIVMDELLKWWHLRFCSYVPEQRAATPEVYCRDGLPWYQTQ